MGVKTVSGELRHLPQFTQVLGTELGFEPWSVWFQSSLYTKVTAFLLSHHGASEIERDT